MIISVVTKEHCNKNKIFILELESHIKHIFFLNIIKFKTRNELHRNKTIARRRRPSDYYVSANMAHEVILSKKRKAIHDRNSENVTIPQRIISVITLWLWPQQNVKIICITAGERAVARQGSWRTANNIYINNSQHIHINFVQLHYTTWTLTEIVLKTEYNWRTRRKVGREIKTV